MAARSKPQSPQEPQNEKEKKGVSRLSLGSLGRPESCNSPASASQVLRSQVSTTTHNCQTLLDPSPTIM